MLAQKRCCYGVDYFFLVPLHQIIFINPLKHIKMAKIKYSALVSGMRNKLNGSVMSKNRYGSYVRNKTTPVNPQTGYQQAQRQQLGTLSSDWRGLTAAQRKAWRDNAGQFPSTDIFGDPITYAGNALYVSLNKNLLNAEQTKIDDIPTPVGIPTFSATGLTATAGTPSLDIAVSDASAPTGFTVLVYATDNIGPGINYIKNKLRLIGVGTVATSSIDALTLWEDRFGTLVEGQQIFVRIALVSNTTGQAGVPTQVSAVVGA